MKKIINPFCMLSAGVLLLAGCSADDILRYDASDSSIYFTTNNKEISFLDTPDLEYLDVEIPITLVGPTTGYDRKIDYLIDEEVTTANDKQYSIVDASIKAGKTSGAITVRVMNDKPVLENGNLIVGLKIRPNDQLAIDFTGGSDVSRLIWTNQITMPDWIIYRSNYILRYITYTDLYVDGKYVYGEQDKEGTRTLCYKDYRAKGIYSRKLMEILREIWPAKLNVLGMYGRDEETLEKYPMITINADPYFALLMHRLETYVSNYNAAHPDAPLRHSDDAAIYAGETIASIKFKDVTYKLEVKENPLIKVNWYGL